MRRRLSSLQTFLLKFIYPLFWPPFFVVGGRMFLPEVRDQSPLFFWTMLFVWSTATFFVYWNAMRLKRVYVDDQFLYVSNYFKEISISLSEILDVRQAQWGNNQPISVRLKSPSEFGDKIVFMPTARAFPFGTHPVISELRTLARSAGVRRRRFDDSDW